MNERIHEIARQTGYTWHVTGNPQMVAYYEFAPEKLEEFAELIVRECIELRKDVLLKGLPSEEYEEGFWEGLREYESMIAKHFGVEE